MEIVAYIARSGIARFTDGPTIYRSLRILRIPRLDCTIYRRDGFLESAEHILALELKQSRCKVRTWLQLHVYMYIYMYPLCMVSYLAPLKVITCVANYTSCDPQLQADWPAALPVCCSHPQIYAGADGAL